MYYKDYDNLDKIILGTGNYSSVKKGNRVSIAKDNIKFKGHFYFKNIAPDEETISTYQKKREILLKYKEQLKIDKELQEFKKQIEADFIISYYKTKLKYLDAEELLVTLRRKFGDKITLLSSEEIDEISHRRLLADWIELETGIYIPEVSVDKEGQVKKLLPIRYKNRLKDTMNKYW